MPDLAKHFRGSKTGRDRQPVGLRRNVDGGKKVAGVAPSPSI